MATANLRKAAVFVMSLPRPQAAELLARLTPEQAAAVSAEMAQLRQLAGGEQEAVVREFVAKISASPFQFLHGLGAEDLLALLADQLPQTIAIILSYLPAQRAAEVIDLLAPERQAAVVDRIAALEQPGPEIVRDVAAAVQRRLAGARQQPRVGLIGVVRMLNAMRPKAERKLLGEIAQADPNLLGQIRRAMFGDDVAARAGWDVVEAA
jgi:flagellar motor switch protein FliG